jgi:hypothetical protein
LCVLKLLLGDRGGSQFGLCSFSQSTGKTSPTATNLQNIVMRLDIKFINDAIILGKGSFFQSTFFLFIDPTGIGHGGIEH